MKVLYPGIKFVSWSEVLYQRYYEIGNPGIKFCSQPIKREQGSFKTRGKFFPLTSGHFTNPCRKEDSEVAHLERPGFKSCLP
jgi:hypothetical protein